MAKLITLPQNAITRLVELHLTGNKQVETVCVQQYDSKSVYIIATVYDNGILYPVTETDAVEYVATKPNGDGICNDCGRDSNGNIVYEITANTTAQCGWFDAQFKIHDSSGGTKSTPKFKMSIDRSALSNETIIGSPEFNALDELIKDANVALVNIKNISTNEQIRIIDESSRKLSETSRVSAESIRNTDEKARKASEITRNNDEANRKTAETGRVNAESIRDTDEKVRKTSESTRITDENIRKSNETTRQNQETIRQNFYNAYKVHEKYSPSNPYAVNNKVIYQGGTYLCIAPTTGNAPSYNTDNAWWVCLAAKGQDGTGVGDMVTGIYDLDNKRTDIFKYADDYYDELTNAINSKLDANKVSDSDNVTEDGYAYAAKRGKALRDDLNALATTVGTKANNDHIQALDKGGTGAITAAQARTNLGVAYGTTAETVCQGNDDRLSDARTPTAHNQSASTITGGTFGGQVVAPAGTDYTTARIRNAIILSSDPGNGASVGYPNGTIIFVKG